MRWAAVSLILPRGLLIHVSSILDTPRLQAGEEKMAARRQDSLAGEEQKHGLLLA